MKVFLYIKKMRGRRSLYATVFVILISFGAGLGIRWDITGDWEGIYLLFDREQRRVTVTDDIFPGDADKLVAGGPFSWFRHLMFAESSDASSASLLKVAWDEKQGRGYIKNSYQDGRKLLINLSRFRNEDGELTSGIFLGGGLPQSDPDYQKNNDETGMSYYDGKRWHHIWCSVNEAVFPASNPGLLIYPQQWQFLGSKILENSINKNVSIVSRHRFFIDGVPLAVEKYFFYVAGDIYYTMVTKVTNTGNRPAAFYYLYGDEPWVGHYGSSRGNVGWVKDGLVKTEDDVDTRNTTFAGMFDYGNDLAGETHDYSWKANFIEWSAEKQPDKVYFSNHIGKFTPPGSTKVPLCSDNCRFLSLHWGPRNLGPRQSFSFTLAIGMADTNPQTGFPVKPVTRLN